jgi:hypothetical protein
MAGSKNCNHNRDHSGRVVQIAHATGCPQPAEADISQNAADSRFGPGADGSCATQQSSLFLEREYWKG